LIGGNQLINVDINEKNHKKYRPPLNARFIKRGGYILKARKISTMNFI
jgi:hypothetical protein